MKLRKEPFEIPRSIIRNEGMSTIHELALKAKAKSLQACRFFSHRNEALECSPAPEHHIGVGVRIYAHIYYFYHRKEALFLEQCRRKLIAKLFRE